MALGERGYDVVVGAGARHQLAATVAAAVPEARRAAVVTQSGIDVDVDTGLPTQRFEVPDGERAKSLGTRSRPCVGPSPGPDIGRSDVVVAVGGGVVTDLAGFAAASFHRGMAYVNVATTLLAQVDAAIGGKTGVNLPEGKNLVGAFWQPRAVLCDTDVLATLPPREWASGRGEMAKYAFLSEPPGARFASRSAPTRSGGPVRRHQGRGGGGRRAGGRPSDGAQLRPHAGPRPGGQRLRRPGRARPPPRRGGGGRPGLRRPPGPAARTHRREGVERHRRVVGAFDLSPTCPPQADPASLLTFMARDKKARHDLTFVLDGPRGVEVVHGVDQADVVATLADMRGPAQEVQP